MVVSAMLALLITLTPAGDTVPGDGAGPRPPSDGAGVPLPDRLPYPGGFFGQDETTDVSIENLRFCVRQCRPDAVAYVRAPTGPVPGSDNPRAVVYMQRGADFAWTYRDTSCDTLHCAGHDIRIEDGTADGRELGRVSAETGHQVLTWTIPMDAQPESVIRYFCARHAALGMTGAFQILPIGVLGVSLPHGTPGRS